MRVTKQKMTNAGCGGRENQDWLWCRVGTYAKKKIVLAVCCDGVGDATAGGETGKKVIDYIVGSFWAHLKEFEQEKKNGDELCKILGDVIHYANHTIYEKSQRKNIRTGTTASVFLMVGTKYYMLNVGDSRIYWKTAKGMYRTVDQTLFQEKTARGETATEKDSHVLMQSVGSQEEVHPDLYQGEVQMPMCVMLMTDGAYRPFDKKELYQYCSNGDIQNLKRQALKREEPDNLSCIWLGIS